MLEKKNAVKEWRDLLGPTDPKIAKKECPKTIRAIYGTDITQNACHGSDSFDSALRELDFFFDEPN